MPERDDDRIADIVDQQLRYLRGEGSQPDFAGLTDAERTDLLELVDLVNALADSLPSSPPIEEDPVAIQLGLVDSDRRFPVHPSDPVVLSTEELAYRFGGAVEVETAQAHGTGRWGAPLVCRSLAEEVLVVVYDADVERPTAADAGALFHNNPQLSAVTFTSSDATAAAVVTPGHAVDRLIPMNGWQTPTELTLAWEPLEIALGRHFDRSMPRWDEVTTLLPGDLLEDLASEAGGIVSEELREVAGSRPQLPFKRHARDFVGTVHADTYLRWIDAVRARRAAGEEIVSQVKKLCRERP